MSNRPRTRSSNSSVDSYASSRRSSIEYKIPYDPDVDPIRTPPQGSGQSTQLIPVEDSIETQPIYYLQDVTQSQSQNLTGRSQTQSQPQQQHESASQLLDQLDDYPSLPQSLPQLPPTPTPPIRITRSTAATPAVSQESNRITTNASKPAVPTTPSVKTRKSTSRVSQEIKEIDVSSSVPSSSSVVPEGEYEIERIWGKYTIGGDIYYEVQYKDSPMIWNQLLSTDDIHATQLKDEYDRQHIITGKAVFKKHADKNRRNTPLIREVIDYLADFTNELPGDIEIYAQNWLDEAKKQKLSTVEVAVGIATVQGWPLTEVGEEITRHKVVMESLKKKLPYLFAQNTNSKQKTVSQPIVIDSLSQSSAHEHKYDSQDNSNTTTTTSSTTTEMVYPVEVETKMKRLETKDKRLPTMQFYYHKWSDDMIRDKDLELYFKLENESKIATTDRTQAVSSICFIDLEVHDASPNHLMSQICSVSLDGSKVHNKYIQNFRKPYLNREWQQLVDDKLVDIEPCDNPEQSYTFPDAMISFCQYWDKPGTLFIYQGTNDYNTIVENFYRHFESQTANSKEAILLFRSRQYRFIPVNAVFKHSDLPRSKNGGADTGSKSFKLEDIYLRMFHYSLIISKSTRTLLYGYEITEIMRKYEGSFPFIDAAFTQVGLPEHERVDIWYWTNGAMKPVFHQAHTDALVLRNCTIAVLIYLMFIPELQPEDNEVVYNEIMTYLYCNTAVFRKFHLGCKSTQATSLLWQIVSSQNSSSLSNSLYLINSMALKRKTMKLDILVEENRRSWRTTEFQRPTLTFPGGRLVEDFEQAIESITDLDPEESKETVYQFKPYRDLSRPIKALNPSRTKYLPDKTLILQDIIWENQMKLEGTSIHVPHSYTSLGNDFASYTSQNVSRAELERMKSSPCIVVQGTNSTAERFPKTLLLHCYGCPHISYEGQPDSIRDSYQQSLNVINFKKRTSFSYRFRFCKTCKKWQNTQAQTIPMYSQAAEEREQSERQQKDSDTFGLVNKALDILNNNNNTRVKLEPSPLQLSSFAASQQQQPIIVQSPPVYIQNFPGGSGPASRTRARVNQSQQHPQPLVSSSNSNRRPQLYSPPYELRNNNNANNIRVRGGAN